MGKPIPARSPKLSTPSLGLMGKEEPLRVTEQEHRPAERRCHLAADSSLSHRKIKLSLTFRQNLGCRGGVGRPRRYRHLLPRLLPEFQP